MRNWVQKKQVKSVYAYVSCTDFGLMSLRLLLINVCSMVLEPEPRSYPFLPEQELEF